MTGQDLPPSVRDDAAAVDDVGRPVRVSDRGPAAAVPAARPERGLGQRLLAVHGRDRRRALLHQDACTPSTSITIPRRSSCTRASSSRAGRLRGAWVSYALGSDNRDLPNFVVMNSGSLGGRRRRMPRFGAPAFCHRITKGSSSAPARSGALREQPARVSTARIGARCSMRSRDLARLQYDDVARPGDPVAREPVRDGLPDAGVGPGGGRHLATSRPHVLDMYGPDVTQARHVRARTACSPAGSPSAACGSSSSIACGWDHASRASSRSCRRSCQDDRPAERGPRDGPEAARPARRHARDLGRRVRPHAVRAGPIDNPLVGRDHHGGCFTLWLAGGGVKAGLSTARPTTSATTS